MKIRTCLLVSQDPDDHAHFMEALEEVAADVVLMIVMDGRKALHLMRANRHVPDYLIVDLDLEENRAHLLPNLETDTALSAVNVIAYGDPNDHPPPAFRVISAFLDYDISYSVLRSTLRSLMNPSSEESGKRDVG